MPGPTGNLLPTKLVMNKNLIPKLLKTFGFKIKKLDKKSMDKDYQKTLKFDYSKEIFEQIKMI